MSGFQKELMADFDAMQRFRVSAGYEESGYRSALLPFIRFCGGTFPDRYCLTKEMIDGWLAQHPYKSINSQGVFISCLRQYTKFIRFLGKEAFVPDEDYTVRHECFVPFVFTDGELSAFFQSVDSVRSIPTKWKKDLILPVLFRMIYCCGMRPGEPLRLETKDVDLLTGSVYIRQSKGSKDRHITMSEDMRQLCAHYDILAGQRKWFFQKWDGDPLPTYWLDSQFHKCWDSSKISHHGNPRPYDLRHAFATRNLMRWIDNGLDVMSLLPYLSAYMGHSHFQYTLYYIHLLPERLTRSVSIDWRQFDCIYGRAADEET